MDITKLKIMDLNKMLLEKSLSAVEITKAYDSNIDAVEEKIGAYLKLTHEHGLIQARKVDEKIRSGETIAPLAGIPYGMKDNICTKGITTTCASKMLETFIPPYDAFVTKKLNLEGAVLLGKTNMDEFAMGSTNENSSFKAVRNPRALDRVPGGSSGGSAAAVAANEAAFAIGSDTGGSIRQPAAFCGVVGMKPTYGTVSRNGLIAFASSLDQIGTITKCVEDNALVLSAITGQDNEDTTSIKHRLDDFSAGLRDGVKGMKIALPKEYFVEGITKEVKNAIYNAAKVYESLGAIVEEVSIPTLKYALPAYYIMSSAEASSNLARFDGVRYGYRTEEYEDVDGLYIKSRSEGFGKEVKRRIMLGSFVLSSGYYDAYYKKALQVRTLIIRDFDRIFEDYNIILSPVAPTIAYKLGEKTENPLEMYLGDVYTVPINIAGIPSLSLPCGENSDGIPIGMQLIGPAFSEKTLYRAGYAFEEDQGIYHMQKIRCEGGRENEDDERL